MQTPHLPLTIFGEDFQKVYEPADDTFLLLDALENDLDTLRKNAHICLECGCGSGTVITALSIALDQDRDPSRLMLATDINDHACKTTKKCATYHGQNNVQAIRTNLAESLVDRLEDSVDLMVFNPPYVPTEDDEVLPGSSQLQHSWAGGEQGRALINIFLKAYVPRMMRKPDGVTYMIALHQNNIDELKDYLKKDYNIQGEVVIERRAGIEILYVIKYRWL